MSLRIGQQVVDIRDGRRCGIVQRINKDGYIFVRNQKTGKRCRGHRSVWRLLSQPHWQPAYVPNVSPEQFKGVPSYATKGIVDVARQLELPIPLAWNEVVRRARAVGLSNKQALEAFVE